MDGNIPPAGGRDVALDKHIYKKVGVGFSLVVSLLAALTIFTVRSFNAFAAQSAWVAHTAEVLKELSEVAGTFGEGEISARLYVYTGDERYLAESDARRRAVLDRLRLLRELTADNPVQQLNLDAADQLAAEHFAAQEEVTEARRERGFDAAIDAIRAGRALRVSAQAQTVLSKMREQETRLLSARVADTQAASKWLAVASVAFASFAFLILSGLVWTVWHDIKIRTEAYAQVSALYEEVNGQAERLRAEGKGAEMARAWEKFGETLDRVQRVLSNGNGVKNAEAK